MKRVAIYIRVSTSKQDTDNQRRELEAVADRSGWKIVKVYEDAGILELRAKGDGILKIGRKLGVGTSVVQRVFKQEPWQS
jgi:predicted site-specific integrase-resolvase